MKIADKDFILTSISETSMFFDLELLVNLTNPKTKEEREDFKTVAYGLPLDIALQRIASYRATKGIEVIDIETYINKFADSCTELKTIKIR